MKEEACGRCAQAQPVSALYGIDGQVLCASCLAPELEVRALRNEPRDAFPLTDPTICSQCRTDYGSSELPLMSGFPVCPACTGRVRERPFPDWLKKGMVALLLLAALSLFYHRRYLEAFVEMARARRSMERNDVPGAFAHWGNITRLLPEDPSARTMAGFFNGIRLLQEDQPADALKEFQGVRTALGSSPTLDGLILQAEAGVAFEAKDYDTFLAKAHAIAAALPQDPMSVAGVASAHACKFVATGDEKHQRDALRHLEQARRLPGGDSAAFHDYEARIRYRLESREIITLAEYRRRFPGPEAKP